MSNDTLPFSTKCVTLKAIFISNHASKSSNTQFNNRKWNLNKVKALPKPAYAEHFFLAFYKNQFFIVKKNLLI